MGRDSLGGVVDCRPRFAGGEGRTLKPATVTSLPVAAPASAESRACLAARVAADNKGRDVIVPHMRDVTPLYDYSVLASGNSRRQIHTIAEEIDAALRAEGDHRLAIEGYDTSRCAGQHYARRGV